MTRRLGFSVLLALLSCPSLFAQKPQVDPPVPLPRTTRPITVDGDLSDPGWKEAAVIDRFYETSPGDNTEPKVKTTAWVAYDDRYFYIAVNCDDPEPAKIRAPYVDRDQVLGTDDNIAVFIDTRNDHRSALELRVNPRGIQGDAVYNDANGNEDFSPDFFYDTAARITSEGWQAEYRIPLSRAGGSSCGATTRATSATRTTRAACRAARAAPSASRAS
jgi:cellulose/xylan binding protein with CBM9 domain